MSYEALFSLILPPPLFRSVDRCHPPVYEKTLRRIDCNRRRRRSVSGQSSPDRPTDEHPFHADNMESYMEEESDASAQKQGRHTMPSRHTEHEEHEGDAPYINKSYAWSFKHTYIHTYKNTHANTLRRMHSCINIATSCCLKISNRLCWFKSAKSVNFLISSINRDGQRIDGRPKQRQRRSVTERTRQSRRATNCLTQTNKT